MTESDGTTLTGMRLSNAQVDLSQLFPFILPMMVMTKNVLDATHSSKLFSLGSYSIGTNAIIISTL